MDQGKKLIAILLALGVVVVGIRFYFIYQERHASVVLPHAQEADANGYHPTADDYTYLRQLHPDSPKDIATLLGKTVWVEAGDQLPYFPVIAKHVDYAHDLGVLRGATPLAVVGMIQQEPPHSLSTRVPNGDKQVLLAFTLPNDTKTYATPVGYHESGDWHFIADQVLFYDDPHRLYSWSPKIWAAIESHKVIAGMTEQQAGLAVGQVMTTDSQTMGDRTDHFDNLGHPVDVTFEKNHATSINPAMP